MPSYVHIRNSFLIMQQSKLIPKYDILNWKQKFYIKYKWLNISPLLPTPLFHNPFSHIIILIHRPIWYHLTQTEIHNISFVNVSKIRLDFIIYFSKVKLIHNLETKIVVIQQSLSNLSESFLTPRPSSNLWCHKQDSIHHSL